MLLFFAGVLTSIAIVAIIKQYNKRSRAKRMVIRQSNLFQLAKFFAPEMFKPVEMSTQSLSYEDNKTFKYIELSDHKAYWMDRNKIYYAEVSGGRFDPIKRKLLKTSNLSKEEVSKVLFIYSSLQNG